MAKLTSLPNIKIAHLFTLKKKITKIYSYRARLAEISVIGFACDYSLELSHLRDAHFVVNVFVLDAH